jgi:hypothetical protein
MNKTLINITDRLELLATEHDQIADFGLGDTSELGTTDSRELEYPYLWVDYFESKYVFGNNRGIGYKIYTMTLLVVDKITPNIGNTTDVMSDCEGIISDIVQFISTDPALRDFRLETDDIIAEPVSDEEKDGVEGWTVRIPFKIPYAYCANELPFVGATPPPSGDTDATVQNSDNTYNQVVTAGSTLVVPDSTITVNGVSFALLPATISLDVDVVDSTSAPIGSVIGNEVVIGDNTVSNSDDSFTTTIKAEEDLELADINITLNGVDVIKSSPSNINVNVEVEDTDGNTGIGSVVGNKIIVPPGLSNDVYYLRPYLTQDISYVVNDEGWRRANGGNDYTDNIPANAPIQALAPNGHYDYLKYFNKWGHKFRFTGENGGYYNHSDGNYYDKDGNLSSLAVEFPIVTGSAWWVYDHLTGFKLVNIRLGNSTWTASMADASTYNYMNGHTDWFVPSAAEALLFATMGMETKPFFTGGVGLRPFFSWNQSDSWTGTTRFNSTTQGWATDGDLGANLRVGSKTGALNRWLWAEFDNTFVTQP